MMESPSFHHSGVPQWKKAKLNSCYMRYLSFIILLFSAPARAELQNSITLSAPALYPGDTGYFSAGAQSGPTATGSGDKTYTYSGMIRYTLGRGEGRYTTAMGNQRYGVPFDTFEIFQSLVSPLFHTTVTSGGTCPSVATTYYWVGTRFRNWNLTRGPQDPTSSDFYAAGRLVYNTGAAHPLTGTSYIDLVGPTATTASYYMDASGAGCSSGTFKTVSGSALNPMPFDAQGTIWFGDNLFTYISTGGNPVMMVGAAQQTVNAATFTGISKHVFSGIYTSFDWPGTQTRHNIYLYPDAAGTTFTLREVSNDSDPTLYTSFGTLDCSAINTPASRFCSGTLSLQGVGGTGKAVCTISTLGQPTLICAAQRPDYNQAPVSILASVPNQTVLSVAVSPDVAQVAYAGDSTTVVATLTNLSGRAITSLANPGGGLDLVAPFSNSGSYAGTGGTCASSLSGYASCTVNITYNPSAIGTNMQTFRVAYHNGVSTVNATANLIGTAGLTSIAIDQKQSKFTPNYSQSFSATATYSDGSTQDVTSAATWSTNNSRASFSGNDATFFTLGAVNLTATLGSSTRTLASTVQMRSDYFDVLGQPDTDSVAQAVGGLNQPRGVTVTGTKLFVADNRNNRVIGWSTLPTSMAALPDMIFGQPNFTSVRFNAGGLGATSLGGPTSVCSSASRFAIVDSLNHRVLLWNSMPTASNQPPTRVLGQSSMTTRDSGTTSQDFIQPQDCSISGTKIAVSDYYNNRVLIWNTWPTANGQAADLVLGQTGFTNRVSATTSTGMSGPIGLSITATQVWVADYANNRVLGWTTFPTANGDAADLVLGQANFVTGSCGTAAAGTMCLPQGVTLSGTKLVVSDSQNNRNLIWNTIPTTNGQAADLAVGQPDLVTSTAASGDTGHASPTSTALSGGKLYVADTGSYRVAVFNTVPTASGGAADFVLGNTIFYKNIPNSSYYLTPAGNVLRYPGGLATDGTRFLAADTYNSRVLIWTAMPTSTNQVPDLVLGQPDFTSIAEDSTATGMYNPLDVATNGTKVAVADSSNHRVLIWNAFPTANGQAPSIVIGQPDFTSANSNQGGSVSSRTLERPYSVATDGKRLAVADNGNNRVLVWNTWPTITNQAADLVVGQANLNASASATSAAGMSGPLSVHISKGRLYVGQSLSRISVWNTFPTANGQAASFVLGQASFTTSTASNAKDTTILTPTAIVSDGTRLFVADTSLQRVSVWNTLPTTFNQPCNYQVGQASLTSNYTNSGLDIENPSGTYLNQPSGLTTDGVTLFIADGRNNRIIRESPQSSYYANLAISDGPTYDFGAQFGATATSKVFTVSNTGGTTALNLVKTTPNLAAPFYYKDGAYPGTGGTCGTSLDSGASCTLVVDFLPTTVGTFTSSINLKYYQGDGGAYQTTSVSVAGTVAMTNLTISDGPTYGFGTVAGSATKTLTITNPGGTKVTNLWSGTPALSAPFSFLGGQFPGTGGTCTTQLNGGTTCTIVIQFAPTATGSYNDTVRMTYINANSASRNLTIGVTGSK